MGRATGTPVLTYRRPGIVSRFRGVIAAVIVIIAALWVGIPAVRILNLVERHAAATIAKPRDLPVHPVSFRATDGVRLRGWLVPASRPSPIVILVPGFRSTRMTMLPYARLLHPDYTVLLYDSRGTGQSAGTFSFGVREVDDVLGAVRFAASGHGRGNEPIGVLGVSLGSGDAIMAAARDDRIRAVVADSPYVDQEAEVQALERLHLIGPLTIPLAPIAGPLIDHLDGIDLAAFRPIDVIGRIAPRAVLLIHARNDTNVTTPRSASIRLYRRAHEPKLLWLAPRGVHAGALAAQPTAYARQVLAFFHRYLHP